MIKASWLKRIPAIPLTKRRGTKTTTTLRADAATANPTSEAPVTAAVFGSSPPSICRTTFSSTTMASSTTIPIAMARLMREITLKVYPMKWSPIKEAIMDKGIDIVTIRLDRNLRRKRKQTVTTRMPPTIAAAARFLIIFLIW